MIKLYSIKDLAIESGVSYYTVYLYLRRNLIKEIGIIGEDQGVFDEESLERLRRILALREEGKSISEIENILAEYDQVRLLQSIHNCFSSKPIYRICDIF